MGEIKIFNSNLWEALGERLNTCYEILVILDLYQIHKIDSFIKTAQDSLNRAGTLTVGTIWELWQAQNATPYNIKGNIIITGPLRGESIGDR